MKQLICLILCTLFLAGCTATPAQDTSAATTATAPAQAELIQPPTIPIGTDPVIPGGPTEPMKSATPADGLLETAYYTITLPESWHGYAGYTISDNKLVLFELESRNIGLGGHLFSLLTLPVQEDYSYYPSYLFLGTLTADGTEYNLVAIFPTDVQYTPGNTELYNTMFTQYPQVLETLTAKDGCTFTPAN